VILIFIIRNLLKRPFLNLVKVLGLSLALSGVLLIALFLKSELTFDSFHKARKRIYRLTVTDETIIGGKHFARVSNAGFVPGMKEYFPEIEEYVRLAPIRGGVMRHKENFILIDQAFECDSTFFSVFDCELINGNQGQILNSPGSMIVSESFARRVFGQADPSGQILVLPEGQFYGKNTEFTIKGVMKDFPRASHFHPEILVSPVDKTSLDGWAWTYLLLGDQADPEKIARGFKDFFADRIDVNSDVSKLVLHLQKLSDIHLHSNKLREIEPNGNMSVIYAFSIAALILLLTALANYANLNIGMAGFSDKYLFISKVCGASGMRLFKYFLIEGIIIVVLSLLPGGFIASVANGFVINLYGIDLLKDNSIFITICLLIFGILGILAGILPLIRQGIETIKKKSDFTGNINIRRKGISKGIIVIQYTISVALIVSVLVITKQTSYALDQGMGSKNENLICMRDLHTTIQKKFRVFKEELLKYSSVRSVSAMFEPPGGEANDMFEFRMEGYVNDETNKADNYIGVFPCDFSFASVFGLNFLAGTNFSENIIDHNGSGEYIINETAMKRLHYSNPSEITGREFKLITNIEGIDLPSGKIIGVVEDFHLSSIKKVVEPLVLFKMDELWLINFVISINPGDKDRALADIKSVWERTYPGYPFQYEYIGSIYEDVYRSELLQERLLTVFTFMALFICSMGMLGLTLLTTQRRTKEIGIRKINGATSLEVMIMLNRDLLKWIILSIIISIPLSYYFISIWLESFAYRISLSWLIFAAAGFTAFIVTFMTVSVQSLRAARRNPVETLRYE